MLTSVKTAAIAAEGVTVTLGDTDALKGVSFEANPAELVGIIGPNGAGKSTLLRVLAGLTRPDSGTVRLGEREIGRLDAAERARRIAYMPQQDGFHPFTALETVLMGRYPHLGRFELERSSDRRIALEAMKRTETVRFARRQLDRMSGGERQRVVLARALAQRAEVILLDEPSSSLDLRHRLSIMETLREEIATRNVAVIIALHDVTLAGMYCDRLALMSDGVIDSVGTPSEVLTSENLRRVFGVESKVDLDDENGSPQVWLMGPTR